MENGRRLRNRPDGYASFSSSMKPRTVLALAFQHQAEARLLCPEWQMAPVGQGDNAAGPDARLRIDEDHPGLRSLAPIVVIGAR